MDVQMPEMNGMTAATLIHDAFPEIATVLMSADPAYGEFATVRTGAAAFIDKLEFVRAFPRVLKQLAFQERPARTIPS
jgi:DNA-binding NarL/FixJ family response regulator